MQFARILSIGHGNAALGSGHDRRCCRRGLLLTGRPHPARRRRGCAASARRRSAGFLGSAPPAGAARPVAHPGHPLPHRPRLSAVRLSPARTAIPPASMSIWRGCICDEIKVTCTIQARPFDTLLDALNDNRGDAVIASIAPTARDAPPRRFHRSLLPHAGAFRRAGRQPDRRRAAGTARGQEDRRGRRHRARGLSQGHVHRGRNAALSQCRGGARGVAPARTSTFCSATASRWRSGSTAAIRAAAARSAAARFWKAAFSAKASASRSSAATTCCGSALNWALFQLWEKGSFHRSVAALFPDQPVLIASVPICAVGTR